MIEMKWVRGKTVGRGRFGTVSLAIPRNNSSKFPPIMAVKSCNVSQSESLKTEKQALSALGNCPEIIGFFGDQVSYENGNELYNLFLEYASKGSLSDHIKNSGGKLETFDVQRHTNSILKGLNHIHDKGFAHCDIKLQNILVFDDELVKIADFGLAERVSEMKKYQFRGTPLYMSPELVIDGNGGSPADIWALGCVVVEMVSGKPVWNCSPECDVNALLYRMAIGNESPEIPANLCSQGKDFVNKCLIRDPNERWTARMLLDHPFVSGFGDDDDDRKPSVSPKGPLDFDWESVAETPSPDPFRWSDSSKVGFWEESENRDLGCWIGASSRLEQLVTDDKLPDWCDTDGWVTVR